MKKIGITLNLDVTKIDKSRLYTGAKGTYLDLTTFVDVEGEDQYGNNGFITQSLSKEEREDNVRLPILGNVRLIYQESESEPKNVISIKHNSPKPEPEQEQEELSDDDIPF